MVSKEQLSVMSVVDSQQEAEQRTKLWQVRNGRHGVVHIWLLGLGGVRVHHANRNERQEGYVSRHADRTTDGNAQRNEELNS
jgi:hypothetical protein